MTTRFRPILFAPLLLLACDKPSSTNPEAPTDSAKPASSVAPTATGPLGLVAEAMDTRVDPCDDFYRYACGGWIDSHEIPADRPMTAQPMEIMDRTTDTIHAILEQAATAPGDDAERKKVGDFYASCMDEAALTTAGTKPLEPALRQIATVKNAQTAMEVAARLSGHGVNAFFDGGVQPDLVNPKLNVFYTGQGGLGLPERSFYLGDDEQSKQLLAAYEAHVARMLEVVGDSPEDAKQNATAVVGFETGLAKISLPTEELRDAEKNYHKLDRKGLQKLTPKIRWKKVFAATGHPDITQIVVMTPDFMRDASKQMAKADAKLLQAYLRWKLISATANTLSPEISAKNFQFASMLTGQRKQRDRWKRCTGATQQAFGEVVGRYYVEASFPGDSKEIATQMILDVESAFEANLDSLAWMDDATRDAARAKAKLIGNKVGYPDKWRDYSAVEVDRGNYYGNVVAAQTFEIDRQFDKIGKPIDPDEWYMTPEMLNAYADPTGLQMVFPAGILQPPMFSRDLPMAVNFGSIGSVMGHELTHHFDDQGRKFDSTGAMRQWWSDEASKKFDEAAACVVDQYGAYEIQPGVSLDGQQTLGENIADIGGLKESHSAYMKWQTANQEPQALESLTNEQLFFVAYAQPWCGKASPEIERIRVASDVHAHPRYRVIGAVSNNREFWQAFECAEGSPMHPKNACEVW